MELYLHYEKDNHKFLPGIFKPNGDVPNAKNSKA